EVTPILEVSDLTVKYKTLQGDSTAVDHVDLTVDRGEILGIAGESGCGKTTLASSVLRLLRPPGHITGGSAMFHIGSGDQIDLINVDERRLRAIRWNHLAYLPQGSMNSLNPVMKVQDQFIDVMQLHLADMDQKQIADQVPELLAHVGLDPSVARMYAHELSGGMKQRVIMALAVALHPDLLIADEPTTALDVTIQRVVIQNLAELREKFGLTMVVITHDMGVHAQLVDRVAMMYQGKIVEVGDVRQMFKAPRHEYTTQLISSIPTLEVGQGRKATTLAATAPSGEPKLIGLAGVTQIFPGRSGTRLRAVNNVSFELRSQPAEIISLVGASGSGKSTIARILLGLQRPTAGRATYLGKDISKLSRSEYRAFRADVQPVFQDPYSIFNPVYKVDRVFWKAIKKFKLARKKSDGLEIIRASLEAVKLNPDYVLGRYPHQLSGGQRQRLMLARVHMLRPAFIIADEPVSMLDAHVRQAFLEVLGEFREKYGMTTLFITHDLSTVAYLGGEMMTMYHGDIVEQGPVAKLLSDPEHDYTKLLVASVPVPDPDKRWQDRIELVKGRPRLVAAPSLGPPAENGGGAAPAEELSRATAPSSPGDSTPVLPEVRSYE
ncbi:MAG TPA: ABC transporter ATP-binding protein, partial [Acidimicrobiales bacterium]|nr:ABC transporter ATP-binding protein [Acidimicrobiales bacterium]